jgi:hypothetical protein
VTEMQGGGRAGGAGMGDNGWQQQGSGTPAQDKAPCTKLIQPHSYLPPSAPSAPLTCTTAGSAAIHPAAASRRSSLFSSTAPASATCASARPRRTPARSSCVWGEGGKGRGVWADTIGVMKVDGCWRQGETGCRPCCAAIKPGRRTEPNLKAVMQIVLEGATKRRGVEHATSCSRKLDGAPPNVSPHTLHNWFSPPHRHSHPRTLSC